MDQTKYEIIEEKANRQIDAFIENGWNFFELADDDEEDIIYALMKDENGTLIAITFHEHYYFEGEEKKEYWYNKVKC